MKGRQANVNDPPTGPRPPMPPAPPRHRLIQRSKGSNAMQIELAPKEIDYLLQLLAQRPLGESLALFTSLRDQVAGQQLAQHPGQALPSSGVPAGPNSSNQFGEEGP